MSLRAPISLITFAHIAITYSQTISFVLFFRLGFSAPAGIGSPSAPISALSSGSLPDGAVAVGD
jgi:hypothetical protein